ncbi:MAG TPA: hypothetical protein VL443_12970 [Cyclobacteriaceae bacterium]|jgi:hypothetical protein|nr:hypothetical protein [Cyclobacteriaceae bacterium]
MTYLDITKYFGTKLSDSNFQAFLRSISCDPTVYNVAEGQYISSQTTGLEIGFRNDDAIYDEDEQKVFKKGTPIFSLFNLYPTSENLIKSIPFDIKFTDTKSTVREKAGQPVKITDFEDEFFKKHFMIDHFKIHNLAISVDYNSKDETIEFIQVRDNDQAEEHIKL